MDFDEAKLNEFINFPGNKLSSGNDEPQRAPQLKKPMNGNAIFTQQLSQNNKNVNKNTKKKKKMKKILREKMTPFTQTFPIISIIVDAIIGFILLIIIRSEFTTNLIGMCIQGYHTVTTKHTGNEIHNEKKISAKGIIIQLIMYVVLYSAVKFFISMK